MAGGQELHISKSDEDKKDGEEGGLRNFLRKDMGMGTGAGTSALESAEESIIGAEMDGLPIVEGHVIQRGANSWRKQDEQLTFFKRRPRRTRTELVERDLKVLDFILDMRFAGCAEVFERFFSRVYDGGALATSDEWARKRLRQLVYGGFLRAGVGVHGGASVYFATFKAYHALNAVYPCELRPKPTGGLDLRTFVHDREMLLLRQEYERRFGEVGWVSDRRLKQGHGATLGLVGPDVPDAVIVLPEIGRVAIELEIASKSRARYREKISRYARLIRESRAKPDGIRKVTYHCLRRPVLEIVRAETRIYGNLFEVVESSSLIEAKGRIA